MDAISIAISLVARACVLPTSVAFLDISVRAPSVDIHLATVSPIFLGSLLKSPNPASITYGTFPASWPGRKPESIVGSPTMAASAIVPGPALVTRQSDAIIHSSMFDTKPFTTTFTSPFHLRLRSAFATFSFFPQITTIWVGPSSLPRLSPTATATPCRPPTPSPPPATSTVRTSLRPSLALTFLLPFFFLDAASQNPERTGRPCFLIWSGLRPRRRAMLSISVLGTQHLSTSLLNQRLCAPPRSVTTVTKGILRAPPPMFFRIRRGTSWQRGWTDTTMSGAKDSMYAFHPLWFTAFVRQLLNFSPTGFCPEK
mmetsp:Transcript_24824/g.57029  ORF Transcript_24824/g.57029 Transcript_24824/m.57029 type:complete len:313 (-) Transcript_24824:726-1664(-)